MRLNENTAIVGDSVVLVPYRKEHVEQYHEWMKSPELLEATASDPLSLDEEREMQQKWHLDQDKFTFIILARSADDVSPPLPQDLHTLKMIGDVNLFLPNGVQEDVECEIMIAEKEYRGRGIAAEALSLMLNYVTSPISFPATTSTRTDPLPALIPPHTYPFLVRIGASNTASIRLFASLGFTRVKLVRAFDEVEMRFGWVPAADGDDAEEDGQGRVMEADELERLAREKWTRRGTVMWYS
ncbi:hypothetical protein NliqN6_5607 [Naganishia liquefaciens]|uniref:N-acetyltransferase domain-containing protein n=1 Tax=Naganishia liquefaciens TaxID=104408 RepID=A0A8H3TYJ0_9TREE|nr:hypothetical protein NliqN6_5607 [Naganishia liquefaciens]